MNNMLIDEKEFRIRLSRVLNNLENNKDRILKWWVFSLLVTFILLSFVGYLISILVAGGFLAGLLIIVSGLGMGALFFRYLADALGLERSGVFSVNYDGFKIYVATHRPIEINVFVGIFKHFVAVSAFGLIFGFYVGLLSVSEFILGVMDILSMIIGSVLILVGLFLAYILAENNLPKQLDEFARTISFIASKMKKETEI